MKAIILAGGFAKRMWPLTLDRPKPLLPIGNGFILDFVVEKILNVKAIDEVIISTNKRFEVKFQDWIRERGHRNIKVFPEPSLKEEEKLGPVRGLEMILRDASPDEYLIAAGDNLFSLDITEMVLFYRKVKSTIVALYEIGSQKLARQYACVELDENSRIVGFEEKPAKPRSLLISTGIYLLPWSSASKMGLYLDEGNPSDPIGRFIGWLAAHEDTYGLKFSGYWYDIGSLESYGAAQKDFKSRSYQK
jgi:glucose-1-phosphate thymidylyltransferase